jgi:Helix-turn-helix domain
MSFKLQDRIQGIKGVPGKHKRLLVALAKRARNDGTNIYASKETLGELAGVSERTAYRILDELAEASAILKADTHTCSSENCPKGSRHFAAPGNHWTQAYNINVAGLDEAALRLQEDLAKHRQESRKPSTPRKAEWHDILTLHSFGQWYDILSVQWGDKMAESGLPFWQAKQGYKRSPAPLGSNDDSSVLTDGESKKESSLASLARQGADAPLPVNQEKSSSSEQNQEQPRMVLIHPLVEELEVVWKERTGYGFKPEDKASAETLILTHGHSVVVTVLANALYQRENSRKMRWNNFQVFARNWAINHEAYRSWCADSKIPRTPVTKFNFAPAKEGESAALVAWHKQYGRIGKWGFSRAEREAMGIADYHMLAVLRYVKDNSVAVNKGGFLDLLCEVAGLPKANAAAAGLEGV